MTLPLEHAVSMLRERGFSTDGTAIVLGTGLGALVDAIAIEHEIAHEEIPGFPKATVEFHKGRLIKGTLEGHPVLVMQGRYHYYEGYSMQQITFPIRVFKRLGIERLVLSNAAGAMGPGWKKGSLMLITDHLDLLPGSPLHGPNDEHEGPRFPDMSASYDPALCRTIRQCASIVGLNLLEGTYASVKGPNLETAAEYRMLQRLGAQAVGMSTVPEVVVARHMGMPCAAISVLTDECDPDDLKPADIADIIATAGSAEKDLVQLMRHVFKKFQSSR